MFGGFPQSVKMNLSSRKIIRLLLICCLTLTPMKLVGYSDASCNLSVTQSKSNQIAWKQVSPESWFSLELPEKQYEIIFAADVNAKTYASESLEVHYIYWLAANIPHFIRWAREQKNTKPSNLGVTILLSKKLRHDKRTAYLRKTKKRSAQEKLPYTLSLWFPKVIVVEEGEKGTGEFELTVRYQKLDDEQTARRIIESLKIK